MRWRIKNKGPPRYLESSSQGKELRERTKRREGKKARSHSLAWRGRFVPFKMTWEPDIMLLGLCSSDANELSIAKFELTRPSLDPDIIRL